MKEDVFNEITEHIKSMTTSEYNKLLEEAKEMDEVFRSMIEDMNREVSKQ